MATYAGVVMVATFCDGINCVEVYICGDVDVNAATESRGGSSGAGVVAVVVMTVHGAFANWLILTCDCNGGARCNDGGMSVIFGGAADGICEANGGIEFAGFVELSMPGVWLIVAICSAF